MCSPICVRSARSPSKLACGYLASSSRKSGQFLCAELAPHDLTAFRQRHMHLLERIRFVLLTLLGAAVSAATGCMLVYLATHAWQVGQISMKGGPITPSTHPFTFVLMTGMAGVVGVLLIVASPLALLKIRAPASEQSEFGAINPKLYGKTRPALFWTLIVLLALVGYVLLTKPARAAPAGPHSGLPTSVKDGHVGQSVEGCVSGLGPSSQGMRLTTCTRGSAFRSFPLPWMSS